MDQVRGIIENTSPDISVAFTFPEASDDPKRRGMLKKSWSRGGFSMQGGHGTPDSHIKIDGSGLGFAVSIFQ